MQPHLQSVRSRVLKTTRYHQRVKKLTSTSPFLLMVQQRQRRKHKPEAVKKSMPTQHPQWTTTNICQYVQALELHFTCEHYRACGVEPRLATLPPSLTAAGVTSPEDDVTSAGLDYDDTTNTVLVGASAKPSTSTPAGGATAPAFTPASQLNFGVDSEGRWCMMDASGKVVQHFMPSMMTPAVSPPFCAVMSTASPAGDIDMTTRSGTPAKTCTTATSLELTPTLSGVAEMREPRRQRNCVRNDLQYLRIRNHRVMSPYLAFTPRG